MTDKIRKEQPLHNGNWYEKLTKKSHAKSVEHGCHKYKSSHPKVCCWKGSKNLAEKNYNKTFAEFSGKHLWRSLFFQDLKKNLAYRCLPVNFAKFLL